jgi:hypothetical protein
MSSNEHVNELQPTTLIYRWMDDEIQKKYFFEFFVVQTITKWLVQQIANVVYV